MNHFSNISFYFNPKSLQRIEPQKKRHFEVHWKNTTIESLQLLHTSAKERVQDTVKDHSDISKKYLSLLVLILSISSALIAFMFSTKANFEMIVVAFVSVVICSVNIFIAAQMIRPIKFRAPGRVPDKALSKKTFGRTFSKDEDLMKLLLYQELLNCQAQIELNQFYNSKRLDAMDFIIRLLMIGFVAMSALTLIIKFS